MTMIDRRSLLAGGAEATVSALGVVPSTVTLTVFRAFRVPGMDLEKAAGACRCISPTAPPMASTSHRVAPVGMVSPGRIFV